MKRYPKIVAWVLLVPALWFSQAFFWRSDSDEELRAKIYFLVAANLFFLASFLAWLTHYGGKPTSAVGGSTRALLLGRWIALTLAIAVLILFDYQAAYDALVWRH